MAVFALMGYFLLPSWAILAAMGLLIVIGSIGCVKLSPHTMAVTGQEDPDEIVLDEVAGQPICFLTLPFGPRPSSRPRGCWPWLRPGISSSGCSTP